jgi:2-polyprenyl-3-methyl-5-hydroxy-6-metoxy-1,4-benzoquinol methylase
MILRPFKAYESAPPILRAEACRLCGSTAGRKIAEIHYWDLQESNLVRCDQCGTMQYDPMLTSASIETGCSACGFLSEPSDKEERNCLRNYRRGIAFGSRLRHRGISPRRILEIGPGKGFFARGVAYVFPDAMITVLDVVDCLLEYNKRIHGFQTIEGIPESLSDSAPSGMFDFIIARDVLEHVSDIGKVIANIANHLETDGHFYFITPNGLEDAWSYFTCWMLYGKPAQALLNHVNFFDARTLKSFIQGSGFEIRDYFLYTLKHFFRGTGWQLRQRHAATVSTRRSAMELISQSRNTKAMEEQGYDFIKSGLMTSKWFTPLYCRYKHRIGFKIPPAFTIGHEICCLAKKI